MMRLLRSIRFAADCLFARRAPLCSLREAGAVEYTQRDAGQGGDVLRVPQEVAPAQQGAEPERGVAGDGGGQEAEVTGWVKCPVTA